MRALAAIAITVSLAACDPAPIEPSAPLAVGEPPAATDCDCCDEDDVVADAPELVRELTEALADLDLERARAADAELRARHAGAPETQRLGPLRESLAVLGQDAGGFEVKRWLQGTGRMEEGDATLVVFFETWCPHCKREMPEMEDTFARWKDRGLNVVGITSMSRNTSEDAVERFVEEHALSFPIGHQDGAMSRRFGVRGVPAAAIVVDGEIVWRGHPARLQERTLARAVEG